MRVGMRTKAGGRVATRVVNESERNVLAMVSTLHRVIVKSRPRVSRGSIAAGRVTDQTSITSREEIDTGGHELP